MEAGGTRDETIRRHEQLVRDIVWDISREFSESERRYAGLEEVLAVELRGAFPATELAVRARYADGTEPEQVFRVWEPRRFNPANDTSGYDSPRFIANNILDSLRGNL